MQQTAPVFPDPPPPSVSPFTESPDTSVPPSPLKTKGDCPEPPTEPVSRPSAIGAAEKVARDAMTPEEKARTRNNHKQHQRELNARRFRACAEAKARIRAQKIARAEQSRIAHEQCLARLKRSPAPATGAENTPTETEILQTTPTYPQIPSSPSIVDTDDTPLPNEMAQPALMVTEIPDGISDSSSDDSSIDTANEQAISIPS